MELPPSGWYPDPYGTPDLLRWWDGSVWTQHTHPDDGLPPDGGAGGPDGAAGAGLAATTPQAAVGPATVQPTTVQPAAVQPTTVQPAIVQPTTVQPASVQPTSVQPGLLPTTVQPAAVPSAAVPPAAGQPAGAQYGGAAGPNSTQVLFAAPDAWGVADAAAGAGAGDPYGYQRARRRRRIWLASGLAGGTVAALAVIALVVNALGHSGAAPVASPASPAPSAPTAPVAATTTQAPPSPSASAPATAGTSTLTDGQSGLTYTQLSSPWQPTCPGTMNNQDFTWTAGESAVAGQVNGGQTTWYGVACSGPLPQQYSYNGVADLANVANQLVNQFNGDYYSGLNDTLQQQVSQPIQVSGHAAWEIKFLVTYNDAQDQGLAWDNELGAVVVADTGAGTPPAVFYTSVPGNLNEGNVDALVSSLRLSAPPQSGGGSPAPG